MQIRDFLKPYELTDLTSDLLLIPNKWGLVNSLGIFNTEGVTQHSITVEKVDQTLALIKDSVRGSRQAVNSDDTRQIHAFPIPHFPLDDYITPNDLQGKRRYGGDGAETLDLVRARKLERIRTNHAVTLEAARCQAIVSGTVYAPNGTVSVDWYTSFGITRKEVDFVLGTGTTDVIAKGEEVIAHIQDNVLNGGVINEIIVLCSPTFFSKLIAQAGVKEAYKYYTSTQEPLRRRQGSGLYREFSHGGLRYIEYRGSYNGSALIPANQAYALPTGDSELFMTYFSPAHNFDFVNTIGEEAYVFEYFDEKAQKVELQSESNFVNMLRRPQVVVKLITSN